MNYYSSLIYIAFFKGRFYEHPGDAVARKSEFYRLKGLILTDPLFWETNSKILLQ